MWSFILILKIRPHMPRGPGVCLYLPSAHVGVVPLSPWSPCCPDTSGVRGNKWSPRDISCLHPHHQDCVCWDAGGGPKPRLNQLNICTNSSHFLSLVSSYWAKLGCSQCSGLWTSASVYLHPYIHTSLLIHHPNTGTEDSIQTKKP